LGGKAAPPHPWEERSLESFNCFLGSWAISMTLSFRFNWWNLASSSHCKLIWKRSLRMGQVRKFEYWMLKVQTTHNLLL
jgi:hypothetical protein